MKLNRKGFTLIELLAIIVILAIIMLIVTPRVLDIVEDARIGAARSSAMGYIKAVEKEAIARQLLNNDTMLMNTTLTDLSVVSIRGQKPDEITIKISNGVVIGGTIKFGNYKFEIQQDGTVKLLSQ